MSGVKSRRFDILHIDGSKVTPSCEIKANQGHYWPGLEKLLCFDILHIDGSKVTPRCEIRPSLSCLKSYHVLTYHTYLGQKSPLSLPCTKDTKENFSKVRLHSSSSAV